MKQYKILYLFSILFVVIFPLEAFASCDNYPLPGVKLIEEEDKYKIISTYEKSYKIEQARDFSIKVAGIKAQSEIYKFLGVNQNNVKLKLLKIGQCVTSGEFVRVSYGTKVDKDKYEKFN
tara:strand:+ start:291 stop:650 length:360 start_codon:yes stop_codon:yes gene_type:complete